VFLLWKVLQQGWNDDNGMEGKFYVNVIATILQNWN
jgi:hypothetical protein